MKGCKEFEELMAFLEEIEEAKDVREIMDERFGLSEVFGSVKL